MAKIIHHMQEWEHDCGTASVMTLLSYYGYNGNFENIYNLLENDFYGTDIKNILSFFKEIGSNPKIYRKKDNSIINIDSIPKDFFPFLGLVEENGQEHFIVLLDLKRGIIKISDPKKSKITKKKAIDVFKNIKCIVSISPPKNIDEILLDTKKKDIHLLSDLIKNQTQNLLSIFLFSLLIMGISLLSSYYFGIVIDYVLPNDNSQLLLNLTIIFIIINIVRNLLSYLKNILVINLSNKVEYAINKTFINQVLNSSLSLKSQVGDSISRLSESLSMIELIGNTIVNAILNIVMCIGALVILFLFSYQLGWAVLLITILLSAFSLLFYLKIYDESNDLLVSSSNYYNDIVETLSSLEKLKSLSKESYFERRSVIKIEDKLVKSKKIAKTINHSLLIKETIISIASILVIFIGARSIMENKITLGQLTIYTSIVGIYLSGVTSLLAIQPSIEKFSIAYQRLKSLFNTSTVEEAKINLGDIHSIELINYSINKNRKKIIDNLNYYFDFDKNKDFLIKGESGTGKTTLVKSFVGFEEKYHGEININATNIRDINMNSIRKKVIYLSNYVFLVNGTIMENLSMGKKITKKQIYEVCKDCQILEYIKSLPNGFQHRILYNGENISAGQSQKIAIARAILLSPDLMILDESFSNIDKEGVISIIKALEKYKIKKIIITHGEIEIDNAEILILN